MAISREELTAAAPVRSVGPATLAASTSFVLQAATPPGTRGPMSSDARRTVPSQGDAGRARPDGGPASGV